VVVKIAVTSQNFRTVTGHAGKARRFLVFDVDEGGVITPAERIDLPKEMSLHEYKGDDHPIFDMDVVITQSCGDGFGHRLAKHQVRLLLSEEEDPGEAVRWAVTEGLAAGGAESA
jgi:predicted Fe-Mo cluster-binding NifX family protein